MPAESDPYLFLTVFFIVAVAFPLVPLLLARAWAVKFSPQKPGPEKSSTYECGVVSKGDPMVRFKAEYYLYGILFLVFDVEAIFLLPFAVKFQELTATGSVGGSLAMLLFVLLLAEGLAWAWMKGILSWK